MSNLDSSGNIYRLPANYLPYSYNATIDTEPSSGFLLQCFSGDGQDITVNSAPLNAGDAYNSCNGLGVFMVNLNGTPKLNPIPFSFSDLSNVGLAEIDDGYVLYPDFAIQLFTGTGYSTSSAPSQVLLNNTVQPKLFNFNTVAQLPGTTIYDTSGIPASRNSTNSILVFYRGSQVRCQGIS